MRALILVPFLALGACTMAVAPPATGPGPVAPPPTADPAAQRAVAACRAAAEAQSIAVRGVEGSEEVRGTGGFATGQNVFLAVNRSGAAYTLRCSYNYATAEARIMSL
jgi:hypothetical protein